MDLSDPIDREALALFAALEDVPPERQNTLAYKENAHPLMRLLGLVSEFWTMNSVLDRAKKPPWPEHLVAHHDWHRCRAVRKALLAAVERQQAAE